jgi:hypothetical protein
MVLEPMFIILFRVPQKSGTALAIYLLCPLAVPTSQAARLPGLRFQPLLFNVNFAKSGLDIFFFVEFCLTQCMSIYIGVDFCLIDC